MLRVTVLVSGGGTNLQAVMDRIGDGSLGGVEIGLVVSNNKKAFALKRAQERGIPALCVSPADYPDRKAFDRALVQTVEESGADLIVLAGFLVVLPGEMIRRYPNRIINVHPSLIPAFCGKGFYGLKVHQEALRRGVKITGATVHFVDEGTDTGPIILQKAVPVEEEDTPETLQRRVMEQAEWELLPRAIALFAQSRIHVCGNRVLIDGECEAAGGIER